VRLAPIVVNRVDGHENIPVPSAADEESGVVRAARFRNTRIDGHLRCVADLERRLPLAQLRLPLDTAATIDDRATQLLAAIERLPESTDGP